MGSCGLTKPETPPFRHVSDCGRVFSAVRAATEVGFVSAHGEFSWPCALATSNNNELTVFKRSLLYHRISKYVLGKRTVQLYSQSNNKLLEDFPTLKVVSEPAVSQLLNCLQSTSTLHAFSHPMLEVLFLHTLAVGFSGSHGQD